MLLDSDLFELRNDRGSYRHPIGSFALCRQYYQLCSNFSAGRAKPRHCAASKRSSSREQLITEQFLHHRSRDALAEHMIAGIDYVNTALLAEPLDRRSGLQLQKIDSRLTARKHEDSLYSSSDNFLEFRAKIIG